MDSSPHQGLLLLLQDQPECYLCHATFPNFSASLLGQPDSVCSTELCYSLRFAVHLGIKLSWNASLSPLRLSLDSPGQF